MSESIPMIVRISGLPVETLEGFSGGASVGEVERMLCLENEVREARSELIEKAYRELPTAPPAVRPLLLTIKRDCFNGRKLGRHRSNPQWEEATRILHPFADRILELEARLDDQILAAQAAYRNEEVRQRRFLLKLLENSEFLRGVALASPDLVHNVGRLDRAAEDSFGRRERRAESSLMRYVSRAAVKLSPFSTLTRVALGKVDTRARVTEGRELLLLGTDWQGRSLVRVRRQPLNRLCEILSLHPIFRRDLEVVLNDTIESIAPNRYRLFRPGCWGIEERTGEYQLIQDSMIRVNLSGPMIVWLIDQLPVKRRTYGGLVDVLVQSFPQGSPEKIVSLLDKLLRVGFLRIIMPWPANTVAVEEALANYIRSLPPDPLLEEVCKCLDQIERIRGAYIGSPEPASLVDEVDQALVMIWNLVKPLAGLPLEAQCAWLRRHNLNEDVLLVPQSRDQKIFELAGHDAKEICCRLESLERISNLFSHRYDILHTIAEFVRQHWPGRSQVGFLEFYGEFQALWRQCMEFHSTISSSIGPVSFNPLQLEEVEQLHAHRRRVSESWRDCMAEHEGESVLSQEKVDSLARDLPDLYRPIAKTCFFLQPADQDGVLWVLNRMLDGLGRYSSRYTPLFDEEAYQEYFRHYQAACDRMETPEFVDLMCCSQGDNLNIHRPHSLRVIEIPGEISDFPPACRLTLRELMIDWASPLPRLLDGAGRHLVPVHLGPVSLRLMTPLVRLLAVFGSSDFGLVLPPRVSRQEEDVEISGRLRLGNIILRRRRWTLPLDGIRDEVSSLSDADSFLAINRWRSTRGLPDRVFLEEKIPVNFFGRDIFKPQYLDFTSPLFVRIFRAILQTTLTHISIQEMLPGTEGAPRDINGQRWAIELQLDISAIGRPAPPRQPSPSSFYEGLCLGSHWLSEKGDKDGGEARVQ